MTPSVYCARAETVAEAFNAALERSVATTVMRRAFVIPVFIIQVLVIQVLVIQVLVIQALIMQILHIGRAGAVAMPAQTPRYSRSLSRLESSSGWAKPSTTRPCSMT